MAKIQDQHVNVHVNISPDDFENIVNIRNLFEQTNEETTKLRRNLKDINKLTVKPEFMAMNNELAATMCKHLEKINELEKEMEGRKWTIS